MSQVRGSFTICKGDIKVISESSNEILVFMFFYSKQDLYPGDSHMEQMRMLVGNFEFNP